VVFFVFSVCELCSDLGLKKLSVNIVKMWTAFLCFPHTDPTLYCMSLNLSAQVSFKIRQNHRSAQTMSKTSSSRKDKTINHAEKSENNLTTDDTSEVARMKYLDPNSTDNATEHPRGTL